MTKSKFTPVPVATDVNSLSLSLEKMQQLLPFLKGVSEAYALMKAGPITSKILERLINKPTDIRDSIIHQTQLTVDVDILKDQVAEILSSRFQRVIEAVNNFNLQLSKAVQSGILYQVLIQIDFFDFDSNGNPFIKENVRQRLEEHFTIFLEDETEVRLCELAKEVIAAVDRFKSYANHQGYDLGYSRRVIGDAAFIIEADHNQFAIDYEWIPVWRSVRANNLNPVKA